MNGRDLGLIRSCAGAERLLTFEIRLDELDGSVSNEAEGSHLIEQDASERQLLRASFVAAERPTSARVVAEASDLSDVCFLISPIGGEVSNQRRHRQPRAGSLLEPALDILGLRLVCADKIGKPGMITAQVIDYIVKVPLVIADLSFGNANVFLRVGAEACQSAACRPDHPRERIIYLLMLANFVLLC